MTPPKPLPTDIKSGPKDTTGVTIARLTGLLGVLREVNKDRDDTPLTVACQMLGEIIADADPNCIPRDDAAEAAANEGHRW